MNLREKFIWNVVITISIIVLSFKVWNQFNNHSIIKKEFLKFKNEEVGTDKDLTDMVTELESNLNIRQNIKFKPKGNPLNLANVMSIDGSTINNSQKGIVCSGVMSNKEKGFIAFCSYKSNKEREYSIGQNIGDHEILEITKDELILETNEGETLRFGFFD